MSRSSAWAIVLAGGSGTRLAAMTHGVPKQFWPLPGGDTLLGHTLDRLGPLVSPRRTCVVLDRSHDRWVRGERDGPRLVFQPGNRGTAVGVLLGLQPVLDADPDALVVLSPADHGIARPDGFRALLRHVLDQVRCGPARIVLVAAEPHASEESYGWIRLGRELSGTGLHRVASFVEKPDRALAARLLASGAVWNTMVLVASASSLVDLSRARHPRLARSLAAAWRQPPPRRATALADIYGGLSHVDFSRDVLAGSPHLAVSVLPASTGWSDLGTPERLRAWLAVRPGHSAPIRRPGHAA